MEGLLPYIYRAVVRHRKHQIRHSNSRLNLLSSSAESSSSGRSFRRDHDRYNTRPSKGDSPGRFDSIVQQDTQLNLPDRPPSGKSFLHRRAMSACFFPRGDERSLGKEAIGKKRVAQFGYASSFHYRP